MKKLANKNYKHINQMKYPALIKKVHWNIGCNKEGHCKKKYPAYKSLIKSTLSVEVVLETATKCQERGW